MSGSCGLLLLLCAALVGGLPTSLYGTASPGQQVTGRGRPSGEYQRQQLHDQQAKDREQLLKDRDQVLHDQEQQSEDRQKQLSWQLKLSEQQEKDQQQLLRDQQQLQQDQQRNQNDQTQQLRQRHEEKVLLEQQQQILRIQSQQRQTFASEYSPSATDEAENESPGAEADGFVVTSAASRTLGGPELAETTGQEARSDSDPSLPSIHSLLIYGDSAEQAADGAVHDTTDIRAGSASVRKIVIANALSSRAPEQQEVKLTGASSEKGTLSKDEGMNIPRSEEPSQLTEQVTSDSGMQASSGATSVESQLEMKEEDAEDGKNGPSETEPKQQSKAGLDKMQGPAKPDKNDPEKDSDDDDDKVGADGTVLMQPSEPSERALIQCKMGSTCLVMPGECDTVTSSSGEVRT